MKFGLAFYESIHQLLQLAGVPHAIESTAVSADGHRGTHVFKDGPLWSQMLETSMHMTFVQAQMVHASVDRSASSGPTALPVYIMVVDTGATHMLVWDEQDYCISGRGPANVHRMHRSVLVAHRLEALLGLHLEESC